VEETEAAVFESLRVGELRAEDVNIALRFSTCIHDPRDHFLKSAKRNKDWVNCCLQLENHELNSGAFVTNSRDSHLSSGNHSLNIVRERDLRARSGFVLQDCNCNLLTTKNDFPASSQVVVDCKRVFRNTICSFSFVINYLSTS